MSVYIVQKNLSIAGVYADKSDAITAGRELQENSIGLWKPKGTEAVACWGKGYDDRITVTGHEVIGEETTTD